MTYPYPAEDDSDRAAKCEALAALARKRRKTKWTGFPNQFRDISSYHNGAYDCDHVSPYTKGADNVNSKIVVLLQDWSSDKFLAKLNPQSDTGKEVIAIGRKDSLPTNKNLGRLLKEHFSLSLNEVYATNLFPFIKQGNLSAPVERELLVKAARQFALPQVQIVKPKLVICFGLATFNAVRAYYSKDKCDSVEAAIKSTFKSEDGVQFWAQAHPGHFGQIGRNKLDKSQVENDWQRMKNSLTPA